jgi:acetylornithine deacetylase
MLGESNRILENLISFPTVSSESNLALIEYAAELLDPLGAKIELTHNDERTKANLFATIGPDCDGGVILSGHTDVVPVEGQDWATDPFTATEVGDRIHGRGSCDMKGFIACALAMAPEFADASLARPLHIALTYDEEVGCLGAGVMLQALVESGRRPSSCIIGEPTDMKVIEGHKGCFEYTTRFTGLEGHGSEPGKGVNAIEYAGRYLNRMMHLAEELKGRAPDGSPFDPPWTTISPGMIRGGIARNVIPGLCELEWEFRPVNSRDADHVRDDLRRYAENELMPKMQAVHPGAVIELETIAEVGGLEPIPGSEAVELARTLTGGDAVDLVSFGTEAGLFQEIDIPTVVCGPGSIEQAHKPDEYVTHSQLEACISMIRNLGVRLAR